MKPHYGLPTMAALAALLPAATRADIVESDASGFTLHGSVRVAAAPDVAWESLVQPSRYWSGEHTWSGDPANMTLLPTAGGCFCETLPASDGTVEHARVVYAAPEETLRLRGSLGPLQAEALTGTLTVTLEAVDGGTQIAWDYVVGGHARFSLEQIAPVVDGVIGGQFGRLADVLGRLDE